MIFQASKSFTVSLRIFPPLSAHSICTHIRAHQNRTTIDHTSVIATSVSSATRRKMRQRELFCSRNNGETYRSRLLSTSSGFHSRFEAGNDNLAHPKETVHQRAHTRVPVLLNSRFGSSSFLSRHYTAQSPSALRDIKRHNGEKELAWTQVARSLQWCISIISPKSTTST